MKGERTRGDKIIGLNIPSMGIIKIIESGKLPTVHSTSYMDTDGNVADVLISLNVSM